MPKTNTSNTQRPTVRAKHPAAVKECFKESPYLRCMFNFTSYIKNKDVAIDVVTYLNANGAVVRTGRYDHSNRIVIFHQAVKRSPDIKPPESPDIKLVVKLAEANAMTNSLKAELKATTKRLAATEKTNLHLAKVHTEAKIKLANTLAKQKEGLNEINKQRKVLAKREIEIVLLNELKAKCNSLV